MWPSCAAALRRKSRTVHRSTMCAIEHGVVIFILEDAMKIALAGAGAPLARQHTGRDQASATQSWSARGANLSHAPRWRDVRIGHVHDGLSERAGGRRGSGVILATRTALHAEQAIAC